MTFHDPWWLLALTLVPAAVWFCARPAARGRVWFSDGAALARLPATPATRVAALLPLLHGAGLGCLIVALARPQRGLEDSVVRTDAVDIVLVADVSPSMAAEDFSTRQRRMNRLDAAKRVMDEFVRARANDRLGLVVFAGWPYTAAPLTVDHAWLRQRIAELRVGMVGDGTAIGSALAAAVNRLRESRAKSRVVVLLTDGMNNAGSISPDDAALAAAALGVKVYTVGAGTRGTAPVPVQTPFGVQYVPQAVEIDEALLQRIAAETGGQYFRATDLASLEEVYRQIDRMEKTPIESRRYLRYEERFSGWAVASALLLLLETVLGLSRFGRLPP
ncbi:MAG: VWA domain-containing protein [Kiritimatiellae bacterium]|nr:VWA domain-containing protein [Kiritimatiellia bacterium]